MKESMDAEDFMAQAHREGKLIRLQRLELLGRLTSGFAHDLNNLLSAMLGYLTGIRMRANDTVGDKAIAKIIDRTILEDIDLVIIVARRAADLVRSMVSFSRKSGTYTSAITLAALIEEVLSLLRGSFPENVRIENQITDFDCVVIGEETQIVQVFMNLCLNARDAMPDGGVLTLTLSKVHIDVEEAVWFPELEADDFACIEVSDTGAGITEKNREKIFEPFYTTKENGDGVGLFIVREILRAHCGDVRVESSAEGTKFSVYLPLAR